MHCQAVQQCLAKLNLTFDLQTVQDISSFIQEQTLEAPSSISMYTIYAAAAIISELKQVPTLEGSQTTHTGIKIESFMKHMQMLSKDKFLQILKDLSLKLKKPSQPLSFKIDQIKIIYRIFKKYKNSFIKLFQLTDINPEMCMDLLSIFWIIYLFVKNEFCKPESHHQATQILFILLKNVFEYFMACINHLTVNKIIKENFSEIEDIPQQKFTGYQSKFLSKMQEIYSLRYEKDFDLSKLIDDSFFAKRYLDDLSNQFEKCKKLFNENHIDEISFLEMAKNLTPNPNFKDSGDKNLQICQSLDFALENDEFQTKHSYKKITPEIKVVLPFKKQIAIFKGSGIKKIDDFSEIGIHRVQNLAWIKKFLGIVDQNYQQKIQQIYSLYQEKTYEEYEERITNIIQNIISKYSPTCFNFLKRKFQILSLFIYFVCRIEDFYNEQEQKIIMFSHKKSFDSILSLSTCLFNYAYGIRIDYSQICSYFDVSFLNAFKPINWFGKNAELTKDMQIYLYNIEKQLIINDIWEEDVGYSLLTQNQSPIKYENAVVIRRFKVHIGDRIQQICRQITIEDSCIRQIHLLVKLIIDQKPYMIKKGQINLIILCCIIKELKLNQKVKQYQLFQIYDYYNRLQSGCIQTEYQQKDGHINYLCQFYNDVFLFDLDRESQAYISPASYDKTRKGNDMITITPHTELNEFPQQGMFNPHQKYDTASKKYRQNKFETIRHEVNQVQLYSDDQNEKETAKIGKTPALLQNESLNRN